MMDNSEVQFAGVLTAVALVVAAGVASVNGILNAVTTSTPITFTAHSAAPPKTTESTTTAPPNTTESTTTAPPNTTESTTTAPTMIKSTSQVSSNLNEIKKSFEKKLSEVKNASLLVIGTQYAGKSSLINSLCSLWKGDFFPACLSSPPSSTPNTIGMHKISIKDITIIDTEGFTDFEQFSNNAENSKQRIRSLIDGQGLSAKPDLTLLVVSPKQPKQWVETIKSLAYLVKEGKQRYVAVITNRDQVKPTEWKEITAELRSNANTDQVYWVTNFGPEDPDNPRPFENEEIQMNQYHFWIKIFSFLLNLKGIESK